MPSAPNILSLFAETFRPITGDRARRLADILSHTSLEAAIGAAAQDEAAEPRADLLAYREALKERCDPARLSARLTAEADAGDRDADCRDDLAAEFFGKAAYRAGRGDAVLSADFTRRAEAAERTARALREAAFTARLRAAAIEARLAQAAALSFVALGPQGPANPHPSRAAPIRASLASNALQSSRAAIGAHRASISS